MLKELAKADWLRILGHPEDRAPEVVILRGTRNFRAQYKIRLALDLAVETGVKGSPWATAFWHAAGYELDHRIVRFVRNLPGV